MATSLYIDGRYETLHPTWHAEDSDWKGRQVIAMLHRNQMEPGTVCEIGCGVGGILRMLQQNLSPRCQFTGYEISPQAHARCATYANESLCFVLGDFLKQPACKADLLLCMDVVEHVQDYLGFLEQIKERGHHKLIHVPLDLSLQGLLREVPEAVRKSAGHLHYFTRRLFFGALQETGHKILDWCYTPAAIDLPSRSFAMACAKWPRKIMFALSPELAVRMLGGYSLLVLTE
jgi:SAM-dependent methyltransferase